MIDDRRRGTTVAARRRRTLLVSLPMVATALLATVGCGESGAPSPGPTGSDRPAADAGGSTAGTTPTDLAVIGDVGDCDTPPGGEETAPVVVLDEPSLRGTDAELRLPTDAGWGVGIAAADGGAIVLEQVVDAQPEPGGTGVMQYRRADLQLRRVDDAGATRWTHGLGTAIPAHGTVGRPSLVVDGDAVRVLWVRFDGELPAPLDTEASGSVVLSSVQLDGTPRDEHDLRVLSGTGSPAAGDVTATALAPDGWASVGTVEGEDFVVETFDPNGDERWRDQLPSPSVPPSTQPVLAAGDGFVVGMSGGQLVGWERDGARTWARDAGPTGLAAVAAVSGPAPGAGPAVVADFTDGQRTWLCALDRDGRLVLRTRDASSRWGETVRAWWTGSGLMVFTDHVTLGSNQDLVVVDPDGATEWDVALAEAGDLLGTERSTVSDVAVTAAGGLLAVASIADDPPGSAPATTTLDDWSAVLRLPPPAGDGDLAQVPTVTP